MDDGAQRKRPRPIISCLRCREKKLKCDRIAPCNNCVKAQLSQEECTYERFPTNRPKQSHQASNVVPRAPTSVDDLNQRVAKLEALLSLRPPITQDSAGSSPAPSNTTTQSIAAPLRLGLGTLVVKGSRSRYHGQNDRLSLLHQFSEVKDFINNMAKDHEITSLVKQVQFLQRKSQPKGTPADADSEFSLALLKLREFLPPKSICDRLINNYCSHFERTMRILHMPTFMRQYDEIWTNADPELCRSSHTLPQVTIVLAMGYAADDQLPPDNDTTHAFYLKHAAIDLIQAWLEDLDQKHRNELPTIQVEILLHLARSLREMLPEKAWNSTGALLRSAMVMGLHMDPSRVRNFSPFQAEMRRRLWATILELNLQTSINAGMPVLSPDVDYQFMVPSNLDDSNFDSSSSELPVSKPTSVMTDTLAQVYLASSLPQRIKVMSLLQGTFIEGDIAVIARHGQSLVETLSHKPQALRIGGQGSNEAESLWHTILLDLYVRRPLLCLFRPILSAGRQDHPVFSEIQAACLESSLAILSYQNHYTSRSLDDADRMLSAQQNRFYQYCKKDVLYAALSVCQHLKLLDQTHSLIHHASRILPPVEQNDQIESTLIKTVEDTVQFLVPKVGQRGGDLKDIVFLSLALQSVRPHSPSEDRNYIMHEGAKKTLSACRENLTHSAGLGDEGQPNVSAKRSKTAPQTVSDVPPEDDTFLTDLTTSIAAEYNNFQGDMFGFGDDIDFDFGSTWDWNHVWQ